MKSLDDFEERKLVPIIGLIKTGKSSIINSIYNINSLETKGGICTKYVNLLRYNPDIPEQIFYKLKIIEDENGEIKFIKDAKYMKEKKGYIQGEKNIAEEIKKINENIEKLKDEIDYKDIFYMTEINEISFKECKDYFLTHDLLDVPGLSEYQNSSVENIKNIEVDNNINEDKIYKLIQRDLRKKNYTTEIFKLIKNKMDGGIINLSIESYYFIDNFKIIAMINKILNRPIKNFLILLNKMDLATNYKNDILKCRATFMHAFPKSNFNLYDNTFVPTSAKQLKSEILMNSDFLYLLKYHFYNYYQKIRQNNENDKNLTLIEHIKRILSLQVDSKINPINEINKYSNYNELYRYLIKFIHSINEEYKADSYILGFNESDINNESKVNEDEIDEPLDEIDEPEEEANNNNYKSIEDLKPMELLKFLFIFKDLYKQQKSINTIEIENYFKQCYLSNKVECEYVDKANLDKNLFEISQILQNFCEKDIDKNENAFVIENINKFSLFFKSYKKSYIPILGNSNAGKTTLLNDIVGINLFPMLLKECTKRGIIVSYNESNQILIRKVYFKEVKIKNQNYYYFEEGKIQGFGYNIVKNILNDLNNEIPEDEDEFFYEVSINIKLFDELNLPLELKHQICFIDFPGFGKENPKLNEKYYKICKYSRGFIFVVRNLTIKEKVLQSYLENIAKIINQERKGLIYDFFDSSIFIINCEKDEVLNEKNNEVAISQLKEIFNTNQKLYFEFCNALYYLDYISKYNYYNNVDFVLQNILDRYIETQENISKGNIESFNKKYTFPEYLINVISKDMSNDFIYDIKKDKAEIKNDDCKKQLDSFINKYKGKGIFKNINSYRKKIEKYLAKGIELINSDNTKFDELKLKSNYIKIKEILSFHINNIRIKVNVDLRSKLTEIMKQLNILFQEYKPELTESEKNTIDTLKSKIDDIKNKLKGLLLPRNNYTLPPIFLLSEYKSKINNELSKFSDNIGNLLSKKKKEWNEIENDIIEKVVKKNFISFKDKFDYKLKMLSIDSYNLYKQIENEIRAIDNTLDFEMADPDSLIDLLNSQLSENNNFVDEILDILTSKSIGLDNIKENLGFWKYLGSKLSDKSYLQNEIKILKEQVSNKIRRIERKLDAAATKYYNKIEKSIDDLSTPIFSQIENKIIDKKSNTHINFLQAKNQIKNLGFDIDLCLTAVKETQRAGIDFANFIYTYGYAAIPALSGLMVLSSTIIGFILDLYVPIFAFEGLGFFEY